MADSDKLFATQALAFIIAGIPETRCRELSTGCYTLVVERKGGASGISFTSVY